MPTTFLATRLSDVARHCVDLSEKIVKQLTKSNTDDGNTLFRPRPIPEVSIEVIVDLHGEIDRLKTWSRLIENHDMILMQYSLRAHENLQEPEIARVVVTLLDLAQQLSFLSDRATNVHRTFDYLNGAIQSLRASNSRIDDSIALLKRPTPQTQSSYEEIVEIIGDLIDRLWSFNTALELREWSKKTPFPEPSIIAQEFLQELESTTSREQPSAQQETAGRLATSKYETAIEPNAQNPPISEQSTLTSLTYLEQIPSSYLSPRKAPQDVKATIIGNGACGKTCAILTWIHGKYPEGSYHPTTTVFGDYKASVKLHDTENNNTIQSPVELHLWDTAGQLDYERLRPLSYLGTDVIILAFELGSPVSLSNLEHLWYPEVRRFLPDAPVVMAGLKSDERDSPETIRMLAKGNEKPVTYEEGLTNAKKLNAAAYVECSALRGVGLQSVFATAAKYGQYYKAIKKNEIEKNEKKCAVM